MTRAIRQLGDVHIQSVQTSMGSSERNDVAEELDVNASTSAPPMEIMIEPDETCSPEDTARRVRVRRTTMNESEDAQYLRHRRASRLRSLGKFILLSMKLD